MTNRDCYHLWEQLSDDERHVFLDALYPGRDSTTQMRDLWNDPRPTRHPRVVLAMAAVLRRRDSALTPFRGPMAAYPDHDIASLPSLPRLQELRGGPLDPLRMISNTAVLQEYAAQAEHWASLVEDLCRAQAMRIETAVAERQAAARNALAEAAIAEAALRQQQADMGIQLLNDTYEERRDLARVITNIYSATKGEPS